jgi:Na+/proline symporter
MLKATAQANGQRSRRIARLVIGALAALAIIDSIGAGAIVAPALLPVLYWSVVTARARGSRWILAALTGLCFGIGVAVVLYAIVHPSDGGSWAGLAAAVCVFIALVRFAPGRTSS